MNNQLPKKPLSENLLLLLLAAVNFTHVMDFVVMAPLSPLMRPDLNISTSAFGYLLASYTLSAALSGIIGSFIIDKYDRRTTLLFVYFGFVVSNLACALSYTFYSFAFARILAGLFGGFISSTIFSIIGDVIPQERRGRATGMVMAAFSVASVLGIPTGLYLANLYDWHAPFILLTGLGAIVFLCCTLFLPSFQEHLLTKQPAGFQKIKALLGQENVLYSFLFVLMLMIAGLTVVPFLSDYLVQNVNLKTEDLSFVYIFGGLATAISGPLVGKLADKFGKPKIFWIASILSIFPIYILTNLGPTSNLILFILTTIFFIVFGGRFVPAMAMMTSSVPLHQRGSFMSLNSSVQQMGSSIAVSIAGIIITNNPDGSLNNYVYCGYIAIAATIICIFVSLKIKQVS